MNGAAPSRPSKQPAELTGCGMARHSRPPRSMTRADSATASGIWSMSCRHMYATTRSNASSRNGSAAASATTAGVAASWLAASRTMVGAASAPATRWPSDRSSRPSRPSPQPRSRVLRPGGGSRSSSTGRLISSCEWSWPGVRANSAQFRAWASQPRRILTAPAWHTSAAEPRRLCGWRRDTTRHGATKPARPAWCGPRRWGGPGKRTACATRPPVQAVGWAAAVPAVPRSRGRCRWLVKRVNSSGWRWR